jgi:aryl-alcohol dehydrogenase-like predicted oxidoreductase
MEQRQLGRSGLTISAIGLGGNTFGATVDGDEAVRTIKEAIEQGITFIDTADVYSMGRSEELVGKAIAGQRETVVVASKCGIPLDSGPHAGGLSRRWIIQAAEDSLRRLGTDYIDLYYAHRPDPSTPIDETLRAMDDLVRSGKVRYIGCSNYRSWEVARGLGVSEKLGLERWVAAQNRWNLLDGLDSPELEQAGEELGVGIVPYTPLASGILTGKYKRYAEPEAGTRFGDLSGLRGRLTEEKVARAERVQAWAADRGHTGAEAAIAWLLGHPVVSSVIAGARSPEQLTANIKAADWSLSVDERDELTGLVREA